MGDVAFKTPLSDAFLNAGKPMPSSLDYTASAVNVASIAILFMLVIFISFIQHQSSILKEEDKAFL